LYGGWVFSGWFNAGSEDSEIEWRVDDSTKGNSNVKTSRYVYLCSDRPKEILIVSPMGEMEIMYSSGSSSYRIPNLIGRVEYLLLPEDR
jgi:hypothetical protein